MIIFQHPIILAQDIDLQRSYLIYLQIIGCIILRSVFVILSIIFVNQVSHLFMHSIYALGIIGIIQIIVIVMKRLVMIDKKNRVNYKKTDKNKKDVKVDVGSSLFWHIVAICNTFVLVYSIGCSFQPTLNSYFYKLGGPLYFITLYCLLSLLYFLSNPLIDAVPINNQLYFLKKYLFVETCFLKYLCLGFVLGAVFDFLFYAHSFAPLVTIYGFQFTINIIIFYVCLVVFGVVFIAIVFIRTNLSAVCKEIYESQ